LSYNELKTELASVDIDEKKDLNFLNHGYFGKIVDVFSSKCDGISVERGIVEEISFPSVVKLRCLADGVITTSYPFVGYNSGIIAIKNKTDYIYYNSKVPVLYSGIC
jgi:hypothetical protein